MLVLRGVLGGKRYVLVLEYNLMKLVQATAQQLELDSLVRHFDATLKRYRPKLAKPDENLHWRYGN
ncbi:MAG: hypothetical protein NZ821_00535 [Gloeomargarita sp. SKYB31]|nr:hypothetical protein [Gloeomargarita sp. SKYG98]MCS7225466.1 hypothetical protein [Gloeomargarita sp. SKYB31]